MPSTSTSTSLPSRSTLMPAGVPVSSTSPGVRVKISRLRQPARLRSSALEVLPFLHDVAVNPGGEFSESVSRSVSIQASGVEPPRGSTVSSRSRAEVVGYGVAEDDLVHALERHGLGDTTG